MADHTTRADIGQTAAHEWVSFPGGELEGQRPRALCPACRDALKAAAVRSAERSGVGPGDRLRAGGTLCFPCYRANLDRERALREAGIINTASEARFQEQLPFEPLNEGRLALLKYERTNTRGAPPPRGSLRPRGAPLDSGALLDSVERFADRRRRAQMAARHALQSILAVRPSRASASSVYDRSIAAAFHAAELQLPESWLPFVVAR
jgi:hypothetical protein